ncbi:helix-turn-helix transcriptional regulator [Anaerovoracaceae bacterium 42-11]
MELNFTKIGEKIKRVRKEKGLTQEQLAELTHLSVTHISAIETARSSFSVSTLVNIAAVLEISTDWILFEGREISHCVEHQISRVLFDCSEKEVLILLTLLENNKAALRKLADMEY